MYTLIVIDMQEGFHSARGKRVRENCRAEIEQAVRDNAHIIFLEWHLYQKTFPELTKDLHDNVVFLSKSEDDGSRQIEREVRLNKRPTSFKVCGINTDCCVRATVEGLTARFPMSRIEVIGRACASDWYHNNGIKQLKSIKGNVVVTGC